MFPQNYYKSRKVLTTIIIKNNNQIITTSNPKTNVTIKDNNIIIVTKYDSNNIKPSISKIKMMWIYAKAYSSKLIDNKSGVINNYFMFGNYNDLIMPNLKDGYKLLSKIRILYDDNDNLNKFLKN
jgi:hypothetical protein